MFHSDKFNAAIILASPSRFRDGIFTSFQGETSMNSWRMRSPIAGVVLLFGATGSFATLLPAQGRQASSGSGCGAVDSAAVVRVAKAFDRILSTGDTTGLNAFLAPDLRVIEAGEVETRQEYLLHHLFDDIEFAKAVKQEKTSFHYSCEGSVAWLVSTSTSVGIFRGRDINNVGAELMILSRTAKGWQIRAVHWSSARRPSR